VGHIQLSLSRFLWGSYSKLQKTTIRTFAVNGEEENEGFVHYMCGWRPSGLDHRVGHYQPLRIIASILGHLVVSTVRCFVSYRSRRGGRRDDRSRPSDTVGELKGAEIGVSHRPSLQAKKIGKLE